PPTPAPRGRGRRGRGRSGHIRSRGPGAPPEPADEGPLRAGPECQDPPALPRTRQSRSADGERGLAERASPCGDEARPEEQYRNSGRVRPVFVSVSFSVYSSLVAQPAVACWNQNPS